MYIDLYLLIFHNFPGFIVMYPGHVYCRLVPCFSVFYVVLIIFDTWPVNNTSGSFSLYQQSQKTFFQHTLYTISHLFFVRQLCDNMFVVPYRQTNHCQLLQFPKHRVGRFLVHINCSFILWAWQFPKLLYKDAVLLFQETTASPIFPTPKCLCFALPQSNFMVVVGLQIVRFRFMVRFSSNHLESQVQRLNFWVASLSANPQFHRLAVFFRLRLRPVPGLHQAPSLLPHGGINYASNPQNLPWSRPLTPKPKNNLAETLKGLCCFWQNLFDSWDCLNNNETILQLLI